MAPLSAVITALVPVAFAFFKEGSPRVLQFAGFGVVLIAVWCLVVSNGGSGLRRQEIMLSLAAGGGFGLFFIFFDQASPETIRWPLVAARAASLGLLGAILSIKRQRVWPEYRQFPMMALAGAPDTAGNALFALAAQAGRLDVAAVLSSLYPLSTVLLARFILKERLHYRQWAGVIAAIMAMVLIAV